MGLDMDLNKIKKIDGLTFKETIIISDSILNGDELLIEKYKEYITNPYTYSPNIKSLNEPLVDWRKANQIHSWFVNNVQNGNDDCGDYEVSKDNLESLLSVCKAVEDEFNKANKVAGKVKNGQKWENRMWTDIYEDGNVFEHLNYEAIIDLLPPCSGIFFGSTNIDEHYYNQIKSTIEKLEKVLSNVDFEKEWVYYNSSW